VKLLVGNETTIQKFNLPSTKRYVLPRTDGTFLESDDMDAPLSQWEQGKVELQEVSLCP
jgi:hypothetical protein